ncbi:KRAB-A domain-containing protein 2-like [Centruroides sculpturatus]|uniref:KRAB-A domain-containing protein 2-like n=1 Tax=Centruroides sculpturatus TaxID=218467 RepID=UPI000C6CC85F|nr:KRAB-A domain-containing protein 2-like [Centruroides sculpturatus]
MKKKQAVHYRRIKHYKILTIGGEEKLIAPTKEEDGEIRYYICYEDLFNILEETHVAVGHSGRTWMLKECNCKYKNVTVEATMTYLKLCQPCQKKQKNLKKGIVVRPILHSEMNSRCQVDLIDLQTTPDRNYKFILVYQVHLTKSVILRALQTKRAVEVAYHLLDIFTTFGAPSILHSDNGREFSNQVIESLCSMWPDVKIVHGKARHGQSQGSAERANQDIENMLSTWMETNQLSKWSEDLRFIQAMKNRAYHEGIKCSPYETMFGCPMIMDLAASAIPSDMIRVIRSEEDLEKLLHLHDNMEQNNDVENAIEQDKEESIVENESEGVKLKVKKLVFEKLSQNCL